MAWTVSPPVSSLGTRSVLRMVAATVPVALASVTPAILRTMSAASVPAYDLEAIFEPFRRLRTDRVRSDRGTGLGLSIVRATAQAHQGTVVAEPREEGGLTMTVRLPSS
ncbi:hypothetical protein GCM10023096_45580 [Nonomuraea ferruginea]